ncbi:MAG: 50S ribosomal protein L21 [Microgenomates group bacterium]
MNKYAVIKIGGSQYKVKEGEEIEVPKIEGEKGKKLTFEEVLLVNDGKSVNFGQPLVEKAKVEAVILEQKKGKKIRVATYKAKSRYRKVKGFRPLLTVLRIEKIVS